MIDPELFLAKAGPALRRRVIDGRVGCPRLGDVDLERCLECPFLVRFDDQRSLYVVCQAERYPGLPSS